MNTTRWTLVQRSRGQDSEAKIALSELCEIYYAPVVSFIQSRGFEPSRARDLAHDFFAHLLETSGGMKPERQRGRFRSYLLGAVKHFVHDALDKENTQRRGGNVTSCELQPDTLGDTSLAADRAFDRQWALTLIERVLAQLEAEFAKAEKLEHFHHLKPWLTGDEGEVSQAQIAQALNMNEGAVKVAIHRLRKHFRELIKQEIAHTVPTETEARDELTHLLAAV